MPLVGRGRVVLFLTVGNVQPISRQEDVGILALALERRVASVLPDRPPVGEPLVVPDLCDVVALLDSVVTRHARTPALLRPARASASGSLIEDTPDEVKPAASAKSRSANAADEEVTWRGILPLAEEAFAHATFCYPARPGARGLQPAHTRGADAA